MPPRRRPERGDTPLMQEMSPLSGAQRAKKELASHPLARVASRVPPLSGLTPEFPNGLTQERWHFTRSSFTNPKRERGVLATG
jgi:hypothetical protein